MVFLFPCLLAILGICSRVNKDVSGSVKQTNALGCSSVINRIFTLFKLERKDWLNMSRFCLHEGFLSLCAHIQSSTLLFSWQLVKGFSPV